MVFQRLTIILISLLSLVGLGTIGASFLDQLGCEGQLINYPYYFTSAGEGQEIRQERILGQSFIAPWSNLNRIDLVFHTYGRQNDYDVILQLLEVSAGSSNPLESPALFEIRFNASRIQENAWETFTFPPLSNSAGKTYLITLQSPQSRKGNAISVGGITQDVYPPGSAFYGPVPVPQADMAFRTCYVMSVSDKWQVLSKQLTAHRPALWRFISFYLLILVTYLVLLIGLLWQLIFLLFAEKSN